MKIYEKLVKECGKRAFFPAFTAVARFGAAKAINMGFKLVTLSNGKRTDGDLRQDAGCAEPARIRTAKA